MIEEMNWGSWCRPHGASGSEEGAEKGGEGGLQTSLLSIIYEFSERVAELVER